MAVSEQRDVGVESGVGRPAGQGRNLIVVIGINRYQRWQPLSNAVNDACGAAALFEKLGFAQAAPALIDDTATGRAIQSLVIDDLTTLRADDSLVLFYAGHGGNRKHYVGGREVTTGYLIPVDAEDRVSTWVDLEGWLRAVALLPAKHILVILDACHSGIALDPVIKWRDGESWRRESLSTLQARQSRRIITSALGEQRAMDSGPYEGHSLFTGCLIEALTCGLRRSDEPVTTGSELGLYVQRRVQTYPQSQQTPDFGTFAFDQRGEMVIPLLSSRVHTEADPQALLPVTLAGTSTSTPKRFPWRTHGGFIAAATGVLALALIGLSTLGSRHSRIDAPVESVPPQEIRVTPPAGMSGDQTRDWNKIFDALQRGYYEDARHKLREFEDKYGHTDETRELAPQLDQLGSDVPRGSGGPLRGRGKKHRD